MQRSVADPWLEGSTSGRSVSGLSRAYRRGLKVLKNRLHVAKARPELVSPSRLIERSGAGLRRKLTLVTASAGFAVPGWSSRG